MDHLRSLPAKSKGELPIVPVDGRAAEVRAIKVGGSSWAEQATRQCS